jgi:hypothetical protein
MDLLSDEEDEIPTLHFMKTHSLDKKASAVSAFSVDHAPYTSIVHVDSTIDTRGREGSKVQDTKYLFNESPPSRISPSPPPPAIDILKQVDSLLYGNDAQVMSNYTTSRRGERVILTSVYCVFSIYGILCTRIYVCV